MVRRSREHKKYSSNLFIVSFNQKFFKIIAFAITISKSQGQALFSVGVWMKELGSTHGQLYVASSRVGDPNSITYAVCPKPRLPLTATRNIVYREILEIRYFIIKYLYMAKNVFLKCYLFTFYS